MTTPCLRGCTASRKCAIHDGFEYPYPSHITKRLNNCLAFGNIAIVEIIPPGNHVQISPHPQACSSEKARQVCQLMREVQVCQRLPTHRRLLKMIRYSDDELDGHVVFEYMRNGTPDSHLASDAKITHTQQLRWCVQATEAVALLHSFGIIHADIKPQNMLLDDEMNLRIIDMSGSSIDELPPLCLESVRFFLPRPMDTAMPCSVRTDLFALGSSLYHIMERAQPYAELDADEVGLRYQKQDFPDVSNIPCGSIIWRCWTGQFASANAVLGALRVAQYKQNGGRWPCLYKLVSGLWCHIASWHQKLVGILGLARTHCV